MQDRPTAAELLEVAADFLEGEVMPELSGRKQFHVRVTVNVLRILKREWEGEESALRAERAALAALLRHDPSASGGLDAMRADVAALNAELSKAIRSGELDERFDEVLEVLRAVVDDKLAIANPRHAAGEGS